MRIDFLTIINGLGKKEYDLTIMKLAANEIVCHIRFNTKREAMKKINEYLKKYGKQK